MTIQIRTWPGASVSAPPDAGSDRLAPACQAARVTGGEKIDALRAVGIHVGRSPAALGGTMVEIGRMTGRAPTRRKKQAGRR